MAISLPDYERFIPKDGPEDATAWANWLEGFQGMVGAMNIDADAPANGNNPTQTQWYKLFFHYIGPKTRTVLKQVDDNGVESKSYAKAHASLTKRFAPSLNRIYQMNILAEMAQRESESMDCFH